ncbi:MAG: bifunctional riboflavin kinase/FAD synthetase [Candidatus Rokubacteria bacterium]|nr:bifunctional riboflavin kinase/FAD synthetase [Candidatus Rokubacteria bacterium]
MRILRGLASYPPDLRPCVAALGAFDGIHLAHAKLISTAVERGRALGLPSVVCTFDPHPASVLWPERAPLPIATLEDNLGRMDGLGADAALVIPFTLEFSRMEAEAFVRDVLAGTLGAKEIVVGFNHTFGHDARGTAALLTELGPQHGFAARVLPPLRLRGQIVSSSAIRALLHEGDAAHATELLGHPYAITGAVLRGAGRGRTLGFPTANLRPDRPLALAPGVYVARATWAGSGDGGAADAVVNVGYRPTFGENQYWVEANLLDFSGDLYDRTLRLEFLDRIRPEMKFSGVDALKRQVATDIEAARARRARGAPGPRRAP